ncbi:MAG: hypothetical protein MJE68_26455 [Proteobacteria bacterium]|nr:hypothetical protein [Pseudomonadota bacterium]
MESLPHLPPTKFCGRPRSAEGSRKAFGLRWHSSSQVHSDNKISGQAARRGYPC